MLEPDLTSAHQWYEILFSNEIDVEPTEFRLIHPKEDREKRQFIPRVMYGTLKNVQGTIGAYNQQGYGVFAVINRPSLEAYNNGHSTGKSLKDEDIVEYRAVLVDTEKEELRIQGVPQGTARSRR